MARKSAAAKAMEDKLFELRLKRSRNDLFDMLELLYGHLPGYGAFTAALHEAMRTAWRRRPERLKWRDLERDLEPDWFLRPNMAGYVFYLDRFNRTLQGVLDKLDYLESLGITYVHFPPIGDKPPASSRSASANLLMISPPEI